MKIEYSFLLALLPLLPLFGSMASYVIGLRSRKAAPVLATGASTLAFFVTILLVLKLAPGTALEVTLFPWIDVGDLSLDFTLRFDQLTAVMCLVITGIGSLIHLYSAGYMAEDESVHRFFSYLNLFLFAMLLLVLGGNLLVLFVGWEGVGLCSYLLIGFWYKNKAYAEAGRKAFIVNRIGDAGFLIATFILLQYCGTLDFLALKSIFASPQVPSIFICTLVAFSFFIGATGKSAQIPLYVWLPDAMAGPTPVSALIHAATMVTAGVYLFARMFFLFELAPLATAVACFVAVLTAVVAALIALVQTDIKKVLAYSTVSQLGFMFMAASVGAYWVAVFHLITHAFFKACLFLGAGSVIHGCHHEQDMREMGGLSKLMPVTCLTYVVSTLAIAGIYPFAGFHSKHGILGALHGAQNPYLMPYVDLLVIIATATAFLTAFYMTRSVVLTFFGKYRGHAHPHESPFVMTLPLIVLALLALGGGVLLESKLPIYLSSYLPTTFHAHHLGPVESIKDSWVGGLGILLAIILYRFLPVIPKITGKLLFPFTKLLEGKFYVDEIYHLFIVLPLYGISRVFWRTVDVVIIDGIVNGTGMVVSASGELLRLTQSGHLRHYALSLFLFSTFMLVFYFVL